MECRIPKTWTIVENPANFGFYTMDCYHLVGEGKLAVGVLRSERTSIAFEVTARRESDSERALTKGEHALLGATNRAHHDQPRDGRRTLVHVGTIGARLLHTDPNMGQTEPGFFRSDRRAESTCRSRYQAAVSSRSGY